MVRTPHGRHRRRGISLVEVMRDFPHATMPGGWMAEHRDLGITEESPWHVAHIIWETRGGRQPSLGGAVEVDESDFGGRKKIWALSERRLEGRGVAGKVSTGVILDRPTNQITARVLPATMVRTIQGFVRTGLQRGATLLTDEAATHEGTPRWEHEGVRLTAFECVRGQTRTNRLGALWSVLTGGRIGISHHLSTGRLWRYVGELVGRHHLRDADTTEQIEAMASSFLGKRLRYSGVTA